MRRVGVLIAGAVLFAGCTTTGGPMSTPSASPSPSASQPAAGSPQPTASGRFQTAPPLDPSPTTTPATLADARLDAIRADLAKRGVAPESLRVVSAEAVTWNDGSWGCPDPGVAYTQALVQGMRVVVEAGGSQYDYRFGTTDAPRLCTRGWMSPSPSSR